jgi:hypothetical protein
MWFYFPAEDRIVQPSQTREACLAAQGIEAEIPQNPAGVRGIGAESPVPAAGGNAPEITVLIVSGY